MIFLDVSRDDSGQWVKREDFGIESDNDVADTMSTPAITSEAI